MTDEDASRPGSVRSILPDGWEEILPHLDRALDAPHPERASLLLEVCGESSERIASFERIIAECEDESAFFRGPALDRFDQLADDDDVYLPPILSSRYEIGQRIALGGMARVYLARDLKHDRQVALKVIRPEVAASIGRELFLREIAIASRLRHPNIVPVYDSGDEAGVLYFVMPYESGRSLRDKIRDGPINTAEVVGILRDVARALDYAHAQGVVHRDIKPDNVMLSEGTAVVTDFGISVAMRAAQKEGDSADPESAIARGTPAYMSPEQSAGDLTTDHRADIYSFGCMAYELLCGHPPFKGNSTRELIEAHRSVPPQPLSVAIKNVPPGLASLVDRCLEKDPAARPQSASALVSALDDSAGRMVPSGKRRSWVFPALLASGIVAALAFFVLFSSRSRPADLGAQLPIVVLPFTDIGDGSLRSPLSRGFSEEIATALVTVPWLRVMSRGGSSGYGSNNTDYRRAGLELGARFLVTGSIRQADDRVLVDVELIDASDGSKRWAQHFDRPRNDLEKERDDIVQSTASALRPLANQRLAASARTIPAPRPVNGDAFFLQVQAQQWLDRRGQSVKLSADYFRRAIAIDPEYAKAYSGLSLALALYPYFQNTPASAVRSEVMKNARKALTLDPDLAQPHIAIGMAMQHDREWDAAEAQFDSAVLLAPHDIEARVQYGRHLLFRGRTSEALAQFQAARVDDPASSLVLGWVAYAFFVEKKVDSARVISQRAVQSNSLSLSSVANAALMHLALGEIKEARRLASTLPPNFPVASYVLAATGGAKMEAARPALSAADARSRPWMLNTTLAYTFLGQRDTTRAIDAFEAATNAGEIWPSVLPVTDPLFDPVRGSDRFQALLKRVGLGL